MDQSCEHDLRKIGDGGWAKVEGTLKHRGNQTKYRGTINLFTTPMFYDKLLRNALMYELPMFICEIQVYMNLSFFSMGPQSGSINESMSSGQRIPNPLSG